MSYGLEKNTLLLKEGDLYVGTFATYPVSTSANPTGGGNFTGDKIGYFRNGSVNFSMPRAYAEFRAGTSSKRVRKDLIQKDFSLSITLVQYNNDTLQLAFGTYFLQNAGDNLDLHYIGNDEPIQTPMGYYLDTQLVDGTPLQIGIWTGRVETEDIGIVLPGNDYAEVALMIGAEEPSASPPSDVANYGFIIFDRS